MFIICVPHYLTISVSPILSLLSLTITSSYYILHQTTHTHTHTHIFFFKQVLKGHDHVIESVCFGKKPAAVPLLPPPPASGSSASAASLNLMDISQKTEKTDDTSLVDIIGVRENRPLNTAYIRLFCLLGGFLSPLFHSTCT